MSLIEFALRKSGKDSLLIDKRVPKSYIFRLIIKYSTMRIRGWLVGIFYGKISNKIFVGKRVKLICKKNIIMGKNCKIHNNTKIDALSTDGVRIDEDVVLGERTTIECTGSIRDLGKGIRIGKNTSFGSDCFFGCAGEVKIGKDVLGGQFIRFHSENHNYSDVNRNIKDQGVNRIGIEVGDNCWIGSGVVFLDGAKVGNGCVIAANAVVRGGIPDNCVIAGVPAKIIKKRGIAK